MENTRVKNKKDGRLGTTVGDSIIWKGGELVAVCWDSEDVPVFVKTHLIDICA